MSGDTAEASKPSARRRLRPVIKLPVERKLLAWDLDNLRASGLTDETIALAQLYTEINPRALAQLMEVKTWPQMRGAALVMPFVLPGASEPHAYRIRPARPRVSKRGKPIKYEQPKDSDALVYFPPRARAAGMFGDASITMHWTEGEKKSLALDQLGLGCVGLTGVNLWHDPHHRDDTGEWRFHPHIAEHVAIAGRQHVIVFDGDAREKEPVMRAAQMLCGALLAAGAVSVRFVCPPPGDLKGIDDYYGAHGDEPTRALLATAEQLEPLNPQSPMQLARKTRVFKDAPIADTLRLPAAYDIQRDGSIWYEGGTEKKPMLVANRPLLLARLLDDVDTGDGRAEVAYVADETWHTVCVSRRAVVDARAAVSELGSVGVPVTSNTAPRVIDWFDATLAVNDNCMPRMACVSRTGWHVFEGQRVFVADEVLCAGDRPGLAVDTRGDRKRLFTALKPRGSLDAHVAALKVAFDADPVCAAVILGALAAPLLEPLGAPNFAIHLTGDSTRGKTSMLKCAASVFGDPDNSDWLASWNVTPVAAELRAVTRNHLPQCYDELGAGGESAERLLYQLVNGTGRARGRADLSMRETPSWHCTLLSTGERELADTSVSTGAQVRVIQLPVSGFGGLNAPQIDAVVAGCAEHSGSLGRDWLQTLVGVDDWGEWRSLLHEATALLRSDCAGDALAARVARYFAVLVTVESMVSAAGFGSKTGQTMQGLFKAQGDKRELVLPLASRALSAVRDWVQREHDAFPELRKDPNGNSVVSGGHGRVRAGFIDRPAGAVYFIPSAFREFCRSQNFNEAEVLRQWRARGWLDTRGGAEKRFTKQIRMGSDPKVSVVALVASPDAE